MNISLFDHYIIKIVFSYVQFVFSFDSDRIERVRNIFQSNEIN